MKTTIMRRLLAAAAALCLAQPALAQEAAPATTPEVTDVDPALWVVRDEDTTIYLFGTIHLLRPGLGWFDEAVKDAFDASDELKVEVVLPA
ncbi:MAG: TraB/GumN family protein, partial [Sphingopyxis sp.]|nr:TraB/GumN family protein [Sphingopyxis sp.]